MHEVEDPGREAGLLDRLGKQQRAQGRKFARLQHDRAACGEGWRNLGGDLVQRPVPRGNQGRDADRFVSNGGLAPLLDEGKGCQHIMGDFDVGDGQRHLRAARIANGRAHFEG